MMDIQITYCIPSPIVSKEEERGEFIKEYPHIYPRKIYWVFKDTTIGCTKFDVYLVVYPILQCAPQVIMNMYV